MPELVQQHTVNTNTLSILHHLARALALLPLKLRNALLQVKIF